MRSTAHVEGTVIETGAFRPDLGHLAPQIPADPHAVAEAMDNAPGGDGTGRKFSLARAPELTWQASAWSGPVRPSPRWRRREGHRPRGLPAPSATAGPTAPTWPACGPATSTRHPNAPPRRVAVEAGWAVAMAASSLAVADLVGRLRDDRADAPAAQVGPDGA